jgi:hypothetical protein
MPGRSGEATTAPTLCHESNATTTAAISLFFIPSLRQADMSAARAYVIGVTVWRERRYGLSMFSSDARRLL